MEQTVRNTCVAKDSPRAYVIGCCDNKKKIVMDAKLEDEELAAELISNKLKKDREAFSNVDIDIYNNATGSNLKRMHGLE